MFKIGDLVQYVPIDGMPGLAPGTLGTIAEPAPVTYCGRVGWYVNWDGVGKIGIIERCLRKIGPPKKKEETTTWDCISLITRGWRPKLLKAPVRV